MSRSGLRCHDPTRRTLLLEQDVLNGLDYLEVSDDQRTLTLFFIRSAPAWLRAAHVRITGGRRVSDIRVEDLTLCRAETDDRDDCVKIRLDRPGDFSCYTLCIVALDDQQRPTDRLHPDFDPRYACLEFSFKTGCPSDLDCLPEPCPPEPIDHPDINYLAKDYASFRQLILDRMALTVPEWTERHVPDLGIALVEVLAYVGDHLSYFQDAVATEAYLDTARQRISVRRHARLVDYRMHEGCNARTWLQLGLAGSDRLSVDLTGLGFVTDVREHVSDAGTMLTTDVLREVPAEHYVWFEAVEPHAELVQAHNRILFHTWGDALCCLPRGSTRATLVDGETVAAPGPEGPGPQEPATPDQEPPKGAMGSEDDPCVGAQRVLELEPGDVLVFEEVLGPNTGDEADADPRHRHAVRLTRVERACDPLLGQPVLEVEWGATDALPFPLCLSSESEACERVQDVSVARGNIVLVDHGRTLPPEWLGEVPGNERIRCDPCGPEAERMAKRYRPALERSPLTFRGEAPADAPASLALSHDPRDARPALSPLASRAASFAEDTSHTDMAAAIVADPDGVWRPVHDLIGSGSDDRHVVAEIADDGRVWLRFGDGESGRQPELGHGFAARYRIGNGSAGNVGAETIRHVVSDAVLGGATLIPCNPLPATGGVDPEPVSEAKRYAPYAFRKERQRAVTPQDYAALAERDFDSEIDRARGELRWTGSWYELRLAVDAQGTSEPDPMLLRRVESGLERYRRIGHDLRAVAAEAVPLDLALEICVAPTHPKGQVEAELLRRFGPHRLADGTLGVFHPDRLHIGEGVFLSRLVAEAATVQGVADVVVRRLRRLGEIDDIALETGVLALGPAEVARLDNAPSFPGNGVLTLEMRGGR